MEFRSSQRASLKGRAVVTLGIDTAARREERRDGTLFHPLESIGTISLLWKSFHRLKAKASVNTLPVKRLRYTFKAPLAVRQLLPCLRFLFDLPILFSSVVTAPLYHLEAASSNRLPKTCEGAAMVKKMTCRSVAEPQSGRRTTVSCPSVARQARER